MTRIITAKRAALATAAIAMGLVSFTAGTHAGVVTQAGAPKAELSLKLSNVVAAQSNPVGEGALKFVRATAEKGIGFITAPNTTEAQKKQEFRKLLDNQFDLETIGRFALGRYWNVASKQEQAEYMKLFKQMVVNVYSERFSDYNGQKFEARTFRTLDGKDTLVSSYLIPQNGGEDVQVDWRVRHNNGKYKIVDVIVAGVSMSVTQRSDFASVIQRGGGNVSALITELKNGRAATQAN